MKDRYIGITQPLNIVSKAYANLDAKYGPYNSIENALENIPMSLRVQGLTVGIIIDNEIKEYWFKSGIENTDLVLKSDADLTSVFQALANKVDKEVGSFLMTQEERDLLEILGGPGGTIDMDALKGLFLSKVIDDIAKGKITFEKGLVSQDITKLLETRFGEFSSGINTGKGGRIDEDGHGELESLIVRSFLEVPELRYNRLTLVGEEIAVGAGGIIEDVIPYNTGYRITLKLEEGEMNPFWYDDIVKGIYHHNNGFKTTWFRVVSPTDATRNTIDIVMRASSGNITYPIPVPFMHIARWGNFNSNPSFVDNRNRQSVLVLSSKTGSITFYDGIDNYGNGYVNSQWGKPAGLEFINNFENLPIGQHDPVLYLRTLLVQDIFKVNHEGYQVTEYRDRGIWDLNVATGNTPYESTLSLQDEVWHNQAKYRCIEHHTTEEPAQGSLYWLFLFELGDGEAGQSSFKSTVFKRTNTTLTTAPTGGDYGSPEPTSGGWTDGIPVGEEKLWASSRIFTSDGLTPQQVEWSIPRSLTDTTNLQLQYSSEEIPGTPTNSPDKWSSTARVNTIWMATRTNKNGVWSTWNILQIKGEKGAKGDNGTSVVIKGKVDNPSELPSPPDVSLGDGYISEDTGDLWVYDGSTEESGATLGWLNVGQIQGDSSYIHIAWADEVTFNAENIFLDVIGFTLIDTNKKRWYGIYVDNLKEDANQANAHKYNWVDTKGEDGKDSHSDEFIYIRNNDTNFGVAENIPNSDNTIDYIPPGDWTDDPVGVTSSLKYEWVCTRKFRDGAWGAFSIPSIWNIFVTDGADGKDSKSDEFIFKVNNNPNFGTSSNRPPTSQTDDYVPTHLGWTDDPTGPTITNAYEWVCKRVFNTNTQTWSTFSIPSLWAKYSKDGVDGDATAVATPYMAGEWEGEKIGSTWASTRQYKRTASSYPVVSWLKGPLDKPIYYFLKKEVTVDVGANSPNLDTENWRLADGYELVIMEAIFSNFAKLGSFVFNGEKLISQQGTINELYSEDYKEDTFVPNLEINGRTGKIKAKTAEIKGDITANSLVTDPLRLGRTTLNENGDRQLKFRYSNGVIAAKFGLHSEGLELVPAMIWYDENGNEIWRAGKSGIKYVTNVSEQWKELKMFRVTSLGTKPNLTSADHANIASDLSTIKCSEDGTNLSQYGLNANVTFFNYTPGINSQAEANEQYRGIHTTQEKSTSNWIPAGWYVKPGYMIKTSDSNINLYALPLYRYNLGKLVEQYFAEDVDFGTVSTQCPIDMGLGS